MITASPDWTRQWSGETLVLAPEGERAGIVLYDERVRPLASVPDLIKAAPPPNGFEPTTMGPIREIVTREGEYGARVDLEGRIDDTAAMVYFGFVLFEDCYARTLGLVTDAARFASFRSTFDELVLGDAHLLGAHRRRRFRYDPPAGWREVRRLFGSTWFDPSSTASLHVGPAIPRPARIPDEILAGMLGGAKPTGELRMPKLPVVSARGLTGMRWCTSFANRQSEVVILEDDRFTYCARLEVRDATISSGDTLSTLVDSIRPIPRNELSAT